MVILLIMGSWICVDFKRGREDPLVMDPSVGDCEENNLPVHIFLCFMGSLQILILVDKNKRNTVQELVSAGLHSINICFYVLIRILLGDTRNRLTQNEKSGEGGVSLGLHKIGHNLHVLVKNLL